MLIYIHPALRRCAATLLLAGGLGGCAVYGPPYAYDSAYPAYGYPTYVAPPVSLDLGFTFHDGPRHGHYRHHGHGWRGHGGWGHHRAGWGHHHGGHRGHGGHGGHRGRH